MSIAPDPQPVVLELVSGTLSSAARALGLRGGERLVALDGQPTTGVEAEALSKLSRIRGRMVLTLERGGQVFRLVVGGRLGYWRAVPATPAAIPGHAGADPVGSLVNWEIRADAAGAFDLIALTDTKARDLVVSMLLGPLRPAFARLTLPTLTGAGLLLAAVPAGWLAVGAVWLAFGLWLHRNWTALWRADRAARGADRLTVLAAATPNGARAEFARLTFGAHDLFSPGPRHDGVPSLVAERSQ